MNKLIAFLFVVIFFTSCKNDIRKNEQGLYYVASGGSDDHDGLSVLTAWKTIGKAAVSLHAGDTVVIKAGTYEEQVVPANSGRENKYIVYMAAPGEKVILEGKNIVIGEPTSGLFLIDNKSYIQVIGIKVQNVGKTFEDSHSQAGIFVNRSHHIEIKGCYTYNTFSSGIRALKSHDIIFDGNSVELACNDGQNECISIEDTYNFEVKNNVVFNGGPGNHGAEGIDANEGSHDGKIYGNHVYGLKRLGIYVDAWKSHTYNIEVFQNVVHDCAHGGFALSSEYGGLLENISVYNNIAYNNQYFGIIISTWDEKISDTHPMKKIRIINNTSYNNSWEGQEWAGGIIMQNREAKDVIIRNNICSKNTYQLIAENGVDLSELTVDHNLLEGNKGFPDEILENSFEGDPAFVDAGQHNFHLDGNSMAIDKGSPDLAPDVDFDGKKRPAGAGYDIGAYENIDL